MDKKTFLAVFMGGLSALLIFKVLEPREVSAAPQAAGQFVGRYQVVNPTPQFFANATLVDTITGDTWFACDVSNIDAWCPRIRMKDVHRIAPVPAAPAVESNFDRDRAALDSIDKP